MNWICLILLTIYFIFEKRGLKRKLVFCDEEESLKLIDHILCYTSSGYCLNDALTSYRSDFSQISKSVENLILAKPVEKVKHDSKYCNLVFSIVHHSLGAGFPVSNFFKKMREMIFTVSRYRESLLSASAQGKAQSMTIAVLPLFILGAALLIWNDLALSSFYNSVSILFYGSGLFLEIVGFFWIKRLICFDEYPPNLQFSVFLLFFIAMLDCGYDIGKSLLKAAEVFNSNKASYRNEINMRINSYLNDSRKQQPTSFFENNFWSLLKHSDQMGAPISDNVSQIIEKLIFDEQNKLEKIKQLLPVKILMPLFACFLPSIILFVGGLLYPQLVGISLF